MARYLIETPHPPQKNACARFLKQVMEIGSHYYNQAEWGCSADVHKSWLIVEAGSRDEARLLVPPMLRRDSAVIELVRYSPQHIQAVLAETGDHVPNLLGKPAE